MLRLLVLACFLLVPSLASAQTGAPVVFFSIFGPEGEKLQQFYAGLFEWKIAPTGDVTTPVSSPLPANIGKGEAETLVYIGVDDINATLAKVKERGGTIRYPRFEVPGRVVLALFKDPAGTAWASSRWRTGEPKSRRRSNSCTPAVVDLAQTCSRVFGGRLRRHAPRRRR